MPWRKISAAQVIILVPIIIKCLAWLMMLVASVTKLMGYPELATVFMAVASALGLADARTELNKLRGDK